MAFRSEWKALESRCIWSLCKKASETAVLYKSYSASVILPAPLSPTTFLFYLGKNAYSYICEPVVNSCPEGVDQLLLSFTLLLQ